MSAGVRITRPSPAPLLLLRLLLKGRKKEKKLAIQVLKGATFDGPLISE